VLVESLTADKTVRNVSQSSSLKTTQGLELTAEASAKYSNGISEAAGKVSAKYTEMIEQCSASSSSKTENYDGKQQIWQECVLTDVDFDGVMLTRIDKTTNVVGLPQGQVPDRSDLRFAALANKK